MTQDMFLTMTDLRELGWTQGMVTKLLGRADVLKPNPVYRSQAPMRLYSSSRVNVVMESPEFLELKAKRLKRSLSAITVANRRANELIEKAQNLAIGVTVLPEDEVRAKAITSYNEWQDYKFEISERWHDDPPAGASEGDSPEFLQRITVNYIRHQLTHYDNFLSRQHGKPGAEEARAIIRGRVFDAIAEAYPQLRDECHRQFHRR